MSLDGVAGFFFFYGKFASFILLVQKTYIKKKCIDVEVSPLGWLEMYKMKNSEVKIYTENEIFFFF